MPIPIACPSCGHTGQAPDHCAGQTIRCPKCKNKFKAERSKPDAQRDSDQTVAMEPGSFDFPIIPQSPPEYLPAVPPQATTPSVPNYLTPAYPVPEEPQRFPCPFCSEMILGTAKKCRHCGELLDPVMRAADEARRIAEASSRQGPITVMGGSANVSQTVVVQQKQGGGCLGGCLGFIVFCFIAFCGLMGMVQILGSRSPGTFKFNPVNTRPEQSKPDREIVPPE